MKCRGMTVDERDAYLEILTRLSTSMTLEVAGMLRILPGENEP
jgi:hypothetical protein